MLLSPIMLITALFSLISTGRIFEKVERVGVIPSDIISGTVITPSRLYLRHFNTRRADGEQRFLTRWIENLGFDRLPELISVVSGQLSLIGVKPLSQEEADQIEEEWQYQRYSFKRRIYRSGTRNLPIQTKKLLL